MENYSVAVALFDFVPVLCTALALALLAQGISQRHRALAPVAWAAAALVALGGLCKASWKLLIAVHGIDLGWLANLLFICMAPGFAAMAFCMFHARRAWRSGLAASAARYPGTRLLLWMLAPLLLAVAAYAYAPHSRLWFFWLLGTTTVANASLLLQSIAASRWSGLGGPVLACFIYNFIATLALSGLARLPPSEMTAWIQEGVNFSAQAALALGFWRLSRRMQEQH